MPTINLPEYRSQVTGFCVAGLERFAKEQPAIALSTFFLYSFPFYGTIIMCLDTLANSNKHTQDEQGAHGTFSTECPSFAFFEWARLDLDEWNEVYENELEDYPIIINLLSGESVNINEDDGDAAFEAPVLDFLAQVMRDVSQSHVMESLNRESIFRMGAELAESGDMQYWTLVK